MLCQTFELINSRQNIILLLQDNTLLYYRIILEAAYSLYDRTFAENIGGVLLFAVLVSKF